MEDLVIKGEHGNFFIPDIKFVASTGVLEIAGESYLEDTAKFYAPVIDWIREFIQKSKKKLTFNIRLIYFNTSSSRSILDILYLVKEYEKKGFPVEVNWYHKGKDPEIVEEVEDYMLDTDLKINLILIS
jgi:hypothetical protein